MELSRDQHLCHYIGDLFPGLKGMDTAGLESLGKQNIDLLIEILHAQERIAEAEQEEIVRKKGGVTGTFRSRELGLIEDSKEATLYNLALTINWLGELKADPGIVIGFPNLRTTSFFMEGERVMVYLPAFQKQLGNPQLLTKHVWVPGTFLRAWAPDNSLAYVVTDRPWYEPAVSYVSPYLYQTEIRSPYIWKEEEFKALQDWNKKGAQHWDFMGHLWKNCGVLSGESTLVELIFRQPILTLSRDSQAQAQHAMFDSMLRERSPIVLGMNLSEIVSRIAHKSGYQIAA